MKKLTLLSGMMACATLVACATNQAPAARASAAVGQAAVKPGADLQSVLNSGADLVLQQGAVYEISEPLIYKKRGQKIFTRDARTPSQFATLRLANKNVTRLVYAGGIEGAVMEHVILDGQRYTLSIRSKADTGGVTQPSLVYFGGNRGDNQLVRECVFLNARSWSTLKVHEGASNVLVENNFIFGAGSDVRGNGREESEQYLKWGDGISFASRDSIIRNNLVIDSTDVGIVLFGSPGTIAEDNVVASISRESLGGTNMVDPLGYYKLTETDTDYRGVRVRNNYVDAYGARIHIAFPIGAPQWAPRHRGKFLTGGEVTGNTVAGGAGGYGYVAHTIRNWKITGNRSTASYSGLVENEGSEDPPDDPAAFVYNPETVVETKLQSDFVPSVRHLNHLLRTHAPKNEIGYRMHPYGEPEVKAVVAAAYLEMLGRRANSVELNESIELLQSKKANADGLRRRLMASTEFKKRNGDVKSDNLHIYRTRLWFAIYDDIIQKAGKWLPAREIYFKALDDLKKKNRPMVGVALSLEAPLHSASQS